MHYFFLWLSFVFVGSVLVLRLKCFYFLAHLISQEFHSEELQTWHFANWKGGICNTVIEEWNLFQIASQNVSCFLRFIILSEIIKGIRGDSCRSVPVADSKAFGETLCQHMIFLQHNESTVRAKTEAMEDSNCSKKFKQILFWCPLDKPVKQLTLKNTLTMESHLRLWCIYKKQRKILECYNIH